jgi:hypothetical protein
MEPHPRLKACYWRVTNRRHFQQSQWPRHSASTYRLTTPEVSSAPGLSPFRERIALFLPRVRTCCRASSMAYRSALRFGTETFNVDAALWIVVLIALDGHF